MIFSAWASFIHMKINNMKKFIWLGAMLGIAIFIIVNVSFGKAMYYYHKAQNVLITESNQWFKRINSSRFLTNFFRSSMMFNFIHHLADIGQTSFAFRVFGGALTLAELFGGLDLFHDQATTIPQNIFNNVCFCVVEAETYRRACFHAFLNTFQKKSFDTQPVSKPSRSIRFALFHPSAKTLKLILVNIFDFLRLDSKQLDHQINHQAVLFLPQFWKVSFLGHLS